MSAGITTRPYRQKQMTNSNLIKLPNSRSREKFAELIKNAWREQLTSIFETGNLLETAKAELKHGEWKLLVKELPFSRQTAFKLITIADNGNIRNVTHAQHLPVKWDTLYELTKLTNEQFADGIKSGAIHPKMQRKDVAELRDLPPKPPKKKERTKRTFDDWCDDMSVLITEAAATLPGNEKSEFFGYLREVIGNLENPNV